MGIYKIIDFKRSEEEKNPEKGTLSILSNQFITGTGTEQSCSVILLCM